MLVFGIKVVRSRNEIKEQCYKLHYDNSKIDFIASEDYIFATEEEAQKECERRNGTI